LFGTTGEKCAAHKIDEEMCILSGAHLTHKEVSQMLGLNNLGKQNSSHLPVLWSAWSKAQSHSIGMQILPVEIEAIDAAVRLS
jgi:hypothetical protein